MLQAFQEAYDARRLDDAYVYGKRFAIFSLNALPKHNYYNSPKYSQHRAKNQKHMTVVVHKLEQIAKWMDAEEAEKERERRKREAERRRREEEKQRREAEAAKIRLQNWQKDQQRQAKAQQQKSSANVEQSALDKLKMLNGDSMNSLNMNDAPQQQDPFMSDLKRSLVGRGGLPRQSSRHGGLSSNRQSSTRVLSRESSMRSLHDSTNSNDGPTRRPARRRASNESGSPRRERQQRRASNDSPMPTGERYARRGSSESGTSSNERPRRRGSNGRNRPDDGRRRPERHTSGDQQPLPPPMAPPSENGGFPPSSLPPPPSYTSVVPEKKKGRPTVSAVPFPPSALEQAAAHAAAAAGGMTRRGGPSTVRDPFPPSSGDSVVSSSGSLYANRALEKQHRANNRKEKVPFSVTKQKARDKLMELKASKRVQVLPIPTHQGRMRNSTNGCAVISPLVVSHHLRSRIAVEDREIVDVIDKECIPLLKEIRSKLGLGSDALIIPSDVHDHLVDKKVLRQDSFVGATGGNIMDRKHLAEFLRLLDSGEKNAHAQKRTGAALFFREHVVSIVKVPMGNGKWAFDLIDSLPSLLVGSERLATRTRCRDLSAFESYIRYYASNKLSESSCDYIDKNEWNDMMADFDPRVFQGFVWGD